MISIIYLVVTKCIVNQLIRGVKKDGFELVLQIAMITFILSSCNMDRYVLTRGKTFKAERFKECPPIKKGLVVQNIEGSENVYLVKYKKGMKNGISIKYDDKGNVAEIGRFKNDKREGYWKTYINCSLSKVSYYKKGKLIHTGLTIY